MIDIFVNDECVATVAAESFRKDLSDAGIGDGRYGFFFQNSTSLDGKQVNVSLAENSQQLRIFDNSYAPIAKLLAAPGEQKSPQAADSSPAVAADARHPTVSETVFDPAALATMDLASRKADIAKLFDAEWYGKRFPDVAQSTLDPLQHYMEVGMKQGRDPNPLFMSEWYFNRYLASAAEPPPPILHYIDSGASAGLAPHPLFHTSWYSNRNANIANFGGTLLEHYLTVGLKSGMSATPLIDPEWYLKTHPEAKNTGQNAFWHYLTVGASAGNNPNAFFDAASYGNQFPELKAGGQNPLSHYLEVGAAKGCDPSAEFSTLGYLKTYPDVSRAKINPLEHFMRSGRNEGRSPLGKEDSRAAVRNRTPVFSRFGAAEYGPIGKVLSYSSHAVLPAKLPSICVHIHLFYGDLADEFVRYLSNIPCDFTLLLSVKAGDDTPWRQTFMSKLPRVKECVVKQVPNIGRDVASWVVHFAAEILTHDIFYHAHTKRSEYNPKYVDWRRYLAHNTMGSASVVTEILSLFDADPKLGLLFPAYFPLLRAQPAWGGSRDKATVLAKRMGAQAPPERCPDYPAGSFFWASVDYLRPLLTCGLALKDFDDEAAQIDGTVAHAIERMLGDLTRTTGLKKLCVSVDVAYNLIDFWDTARASKMARTQVHPPQYTTQVEPLNDRRRIAVYTCVTGGFDEITKPMFVHPDVDYFMFSDTKSPDAFPYKNRLCHYRDLDARRTARFVKTHPDILLRDYDLAIWVDANIMFRSSLAPFIAVVDRAEADVGVIFHATRTSFADEAEECALIGADDRDILEEQVSKYRASGTSETSLIETNFIIANLREPRVRKFFNAWWTEIAGHSLRDQVSVNYAAESAKLKMVSLLESGRTVRDDGRFIIFEHKLKERTAVVDMVLSS